MDGHFFFGISLTASFLAGVLALFAPCCITFLFPSYLGTIFKSAAKSKGGQSKVTFYTLVFSLGLAFILVPIALGFRFFVFFLDAYHPQVYYAGGLILILMGIMTLKPFFHFPLIFRVKPKLYKEINTGSVFVLGLMSGLTSSCCAPVLFTAVTLTTLSPSLLQAILVSFSYVLGIVFPLFLLSLIYEKTSEKFSGEKRHKLYEVLKVLGAIVFIFSGLTIIVLNYLNKIVMDQMEGYGRSIRLLVFNISKHFQSPILDLLVFVVILYIFYKLLRINIKRRK